MQAEEKQVSQESLWMLTWQRLKTFFKAFKFEGV